MRKFFILFLILIFALICFTGCKTINSTETNMEAIPTNGVIVTVNPIEETNEAEEILNEISLELK